MLAATGRASLDELFEQIPASVRLDRALAVPDGVSEMEGIRLTKALLERVRTELSG